MVARLNGVQEAAGSNPVTRTTWKGKRKRFPFCMPDLDQRPLAPKARQIPPPAGGRIASAGRWFKSSHSDHAEGEAETLPLFAYRIWTSGLLRRRRVRSRRRPADASRRPAAGSNPVTRTTSEQILLCSGVFFCLRQNRRHPLRYICSSSQNRTRCAGLRFCSFAVRSYALGRLSLHIDFQVFDRTSSAVKESFLFFCGFCLTLGFFSGQPVHPAGAFHFGPAAYLRLARTCIRFFH